MNAVLFLNDMKEVYAVKICFENLFSESEYAVLFLKFVLNICSVFYAVKICFENLLPKSMNADVF